MEALNLPAYDQWVEDTLFNMPLLAVVSVGNHQAYYPAFGNRDALQPENSRKPWGYTLKHMGKVLPTDFKMAAEFTRGGYDNPVRTVERTYVFQIPNAEAAVITDVDAELRIIRATPEA